MTTEPNDTILNASDSGVSSLGNRSGILSGEIDLGSDVDIYQVQLNLGDAIYVDIDAQEFGSTLDAALRIFDSEGNQLTISDDDAAPSEIFSLDPYLIFKPDTSGEYFIGVSSHSFNYNPIHGGTDNENFYLTTGDYSLELNVIEVIYEDTDPDNTISEAIDSEISSSGNNNTVIYNAIDIEQDVDIYKFQLNEGDTIVLDIDTDRTTELDSALRLFDHNGVEIASNDDAIAPGEEVFSYDSYLNFTAEITGDYYLGVSEFSDTAYDPVNGKDNLTNNDLNFSTGDYELAVTILNTIHGTERSNNLTGTEKADWIDSNNGEDTVSGGKGGDYIFGGADNDLLYGDNGDDIIKGGAGYDLIFGGSGNDTLKGEGESDLLYGNDGADIFILDFSMDTILDFEDDLDRLYLTNGIKFRELSFTEQENIGVEISANGQVIANMMGISVDLITNADFVDCCSI